MVGREAHRNAIGIRSEVQIAALTASEGWNPTEWSREVSQEVEDAALDETDDFGDEPSEPDESDRTVPTAGGREEVAAATDIPIVKYRVQGYLREVAGSFEVDPTGDYSFQHGSARIYVSVLAGPRNVFIRVWSYVAFGSPESPDLYEYVATQAERLPLMGALSAQKEEDGTVTTILEHTLLGDSMGPEEFNLAVTAIATTADALDDVIVEHFGGRTFHQE